ncbi:MAG: BrnT family toxin [Alphaproteobacteria bacterium]|nr:BrnT family toxin [Alphaproteobacteria bacterium]
MDEISKASYEEFDWHDEKRKTNINKHKIDFVDATRDIFPFIHVIIPARKEGDEQRYKAIGESNGNIITIIFTERNEGRLCWVISARRARKGEKDEYINIIRNGQQKEKT